MIHRLNIVFFSLRKLIVVARTDTDKPTVCVMLLQANQNFVIKGQAHIYFRKKLCIQVVKGTVSPKVVWICYGPEIRWTSSRDSYTGNIYFNDTKHFFTTLMTLNIFTTESLGNNLVHQFLR